MGGMGNRHLSRSVKVIPGNVGDSYPNAKMSSPSRLGGSVGGVILLRPCGVESSTPGRRYHWSNVIKAASYLHPKGVRGPEHDVKRLISLSTTGKRSVS